MSTSLDFSGLQPVTLPVKVGEHEYTLYEASGDAANAYKAAAIKATRFEGGKPSGVSVDIVKTDILLISLCLRNSEGKQVPESVIKGWPHRIVEAIAAEAKRISGLDDKDTPENLKKQAADIQAKLDELDGEDPEGNDE